jgi:septum formation protein
MKVILASASPRRAEILKDAGIPFDTMPVDVDETPLASELAEAMCRRLADCKARAAAAHLGTPHEPVIVIAADTTVEIDGHTLGKPASRDEARDMLRQLSGKTHRVLTALSLIRLPDGATRADLESTSVRFSPLSANEIDEYVATGEPMDKAGGYAIQGRAGRFIERIEGCYFNVVGLPLARLYRNLREMGWTPHG